MDSPPGSPLLLDDEDVIPCKGCGNVLEEGKAFELAGNRWHIDCFRCNSCGTLLDSDANLLLLGDGSLICNNCTYNCTVCANKIEDLAILTGDQAFCAGCFRCRNCKRKIENLKYARTSQGIFCMSCHETLMTRRKKRAKASQKTPTTTPSNSASPMLSLDKSLPSLPVEDGPGLGSHSTTPTELSARPRPQTSRTNSSNHIPEQLSPVAYQQPSADHLRTHTPRLHKRHSQISMDPSLIFGAQDSFSALIPLVLDNNPRPSPARSTTPIYNRSGTDRGQNSEWEQSNPRPSYDRRILNTSSHQDAERERSARPHIATQDRSYELQIGIDKNDIPRKSHDSERPGVRSTSSTEAQPAKEHSRPQEPEIGPLLSKNVGADASSGFKLKDVPRERKRSASMHRSLDIDEVNEKPRPLSPSSSRTDASQSTVNANPLLRGDPFRPLQTHTDSPMSGVSARNKSFDSPGLSSSSSRSQHSHAPSNTSTGKIESPEISSSKCSEKNEPSSAPPSRPSPPRRPSTAQDSNFSPVSETNASELSVKSPSARVGFDEELREAFGGGSGESNLRRVSNSVKHGRSLSEAARRSPSSGNYMHSFGEISSPISPGRKDEASILRQELRRSTQRIAELEAKLNSTASAKALEHNIQEKRNTVALLETEREAFLRELMVIKERLDASKDGKSLNPDELKSDLIHGLTRELEDLKATLKADIQALVAQRDQLTEDVESVGRLREQAIQETEQLNMKNAQLADLNNELTRRIQGQFKANKHQVPGLGIYDGSNVDLWDPKDHDKRPTAPAAPLMNIPPIGMPYDTTSEGPEVLVARKVPPFKNGGQQKKFFWKKPGASIMKNAGKLSNRVFASENDGTNGVDSLNPRLVGPDHPSSKLFSSTQKKWGKDKKGGANGATGSFSSDVPMFGGDLELRIAFEGVKIPLVVQKCIQEVEMRGMDCQGIYRKSGGATQMRQIQDEFERGEDVQFDPELDICSVTSILKQYFRNLPNPLITYEVYDRFVETSTIYEQEKRIESLKQITEDLPQGHRDVLQFVIFHLARVAARKGENLMNTRNLAVVFTPTLVRHLSNEREMSDMHAKNNAIQFLIDHNESIF